MGLRYKILFGIAGLLVLFGLTVTIFAKTVLYENLLGKLEKRGISIARHMAANSVSPILTEKYFELEMMALDLMKSEEDIEYIFVLDKKGEVLAHTFDRGFPAELLKVNREVFTKDHSIEKIATEKGELVDIAVPMMKGEAGVVHLGFSEQHLREEINSIIELLLWLVIALSVIGIVIAIFLSLLIAKPVLELAKIVEAAGTGDLDQRANVRSKDEIGKLGEAFNLMLKTRKQAEEALRESEGKLKSITSHLAEGIYMLNELGYITFMNPEAEHLFGWTMDELNEKGPHSLVHFQRPDGTPLALSECKMHDVIKTKKRYFSTDEVFVRKDGTVFPISVITAPVMENGKISASVTAFRDITEQKQTEKEKEKLISDLQQALATINTLQGILPICASCKKVRDDKGNWKQIESYISEHSEAEFSHGYCPE
ncbi:MAG: PAS domain S-box protein, partial [Thermodesulfovibrionales bacterium]